MSSNKRLGRVGWKPCGPNKPQKKTLFLLASTIVPILFGTTRAVVFQVNTSTLSPRFADLYLFLKTPWASRILKHCKIRQDILWPWHGTVVLKPKKKPSPAKCSDWCIPCSCVTDWWCDRCPLQQPILRWCPVGNEKSPTLFFWNRFFCIFHLSFFGCEPKMQSSSLWPVLWLKFSGVVGPVLPSLSLRDDNRSSSVSEWASVNPIDCGSVSRDLDIVDDNDRWYRFQLKI